jgi:hypothetical protein
MKKIFLIAALMCCLLSDLHAHRRSGRHNRSYNSATRGYVGFGLNIGLPLGGVYYADGPQGSFPYYGTPVNYNGFYAPYGYAAYAGPVVTWGW